MQPDDANATPAPVLLAALVFLQLAVAAFYWLADARLATVLAPTGDVVGLLVVVALWSALLPSWRAASRAIAVALSLVVLATLLVALGQGLLRREFGQDLLLVVDVRYVSSLVKLLFDNEPHLRFAAWCLAAFAVVALAIAVALSPRARAAPSLRRVAPTPGDARRRRDRLLRRRRAAVRRASPRRCRSGPAARHRRALEAVGGRERAPPRRRSAAGARPAPRRRRRRASAAHLPLRRRVVRRGALRRARAVRRLPRVPRQAGERARRRRLPDALEVPALAGLRQRLVDARRHVAVRGAHRQPEALRQPLRVERALPAARSCAPPAIARSWPPPTPSSTSRASSAPTASTATTSATTCPMPARASAGRSRPTNSSSTSSTARRSRRAPASRCSSRWC